MDSIQRLFLDKLREYSTKSQASGGPVDAGPEYEKALSEELTKLQRLYGSGDLTKFPEFKFSEPVLDESSSK
uniref:ATP synthase peripheral stalk subunit F6, mitochondrial n=1 Tax=Sinocyclocheilus anshuiensis TaxID=1608454 RepID=A0A671M3X9_9TELE